MITLDYSIYGFKADKTNVNGKYYYITILDLSIYNSLVMINHKVEDDFDICESFSADFDTLTDILVGIKLNLRRMKLDKLYGKL